MKTRKILLTILSSAIILVINNTKVYADVPHIAYNEVNIIISSIMKMTIYFFIIAYIIFAIIYLVKSKKEKNIKIKTLSILLIILIIISIALYFGADIVLKAGARYTSARPKIIYAK